MAGGVQPLSLQSSPAPFSPAPAGEFTGGRSRITVQPDFHEFDVAARADEKAHRVFQTHEARRHAEKSKRPVNPSFGARLAGRILVS
jgi:hypothetical protein